MANPKLVGSPLKKKCKNSTSNKELRPHDFNQGVSITQKQSQRYTTPCDLNISTDVCQEHLKRSEA